MVEVILQIGMRNCSGGKNCYILFLFWRARLLPYDVITRSDGSDETARTRMLVCVIASRMCDKYAISI